MVSSQLTCNVYCAGVPAKSPGSSSCEMPGETSASHSLHSQPSEGEGVPDDLTQNTAEHPEVWGSATH